MSEVRRYAAFTTDPEGGNPAGVVLDASALDDSSMQKIAADVGYSETAFITSSSMADRTFSVRYFSPLAEVSFCGHATIATAVALGERIGPGELLFTTQVGEIPVSVAADSDGPLRATLTSVEPHSKAVSPGDLTEALAALGWSATDLSPVIPPRIAYAGAYHLVIATGTRERLAALDYDFSRLKTFMERLGLTTLQLIHHQAETVFHSRNPFPVGGVVEDPATGAAAAAFGGYLRELGAVTSGTFVIHQGDDMGRPSLLTVELRAGDPRVHVSGTATPIPYP